MYQAGMTAKNLTLIPLATCGEGAQTRSHWIIVAGVRFTRILCYNLPYIHPV